MSDPANADFTEKGWSPVSHCTWSWTYREVC